MERCAAHIVRMTSRKWLTQRTTVVVVSVGGDVPWEMYSGQITAEGEIIHVPLEMVGEETEQVVRET